MTDDEIRLKIANMRGWRVYEVNHDSTRLKFMGTSPTGVFYDVIPDWPGDIGAAWELVDEAQSAEVGVLIHNSLTLTPVTGIWSYTAAFYDPIGGPAHKCYSADSDTSASAICLAWIAWKEAQA